MKSLELVREPGRPAVRFAGLAKSYGALQVLSSVDLDVHRGEVTAVVGPNGAGKTTLIKCLLGLVHADAGQVMVGDRDISEGVAYRHDIGYMPQQGSFPENLTPREVIAMIRGIRAATGPMDQTLLRTLDLEKELDKPVRTLSGGTRQKLGAVLAFMFEPQILVLDEPTAGLDPVASAALKDHVRAVRDQGATVLLTSHVMADLEELCDRVVFLLDGRIRFDGTLDEIRELTGHQRLERAIAHLLSHEAA